MYKVLRTKNASNDIKKIARFIAKDNPYHALSFTQSLIENTATTLSIFPEAGTKYADSYFIPYKDYCIFYKIDLKKKTVRITHIKHAAQYSAYKYLKK
jgi:plasmid stabilization system protein ParE